MDADRGRESQQTAWLRRVFGGHGMRCTRQREIVYEALALSTSHPTAEELFHLVRHAAAAAEDAISLATVYNTLETLTSLGLCRRFACPRGSGACRYDADVTDHAHVALPDGRLIDVPHDLSRQIIRALPAGVIRDVAARLGTPLRGVNVQLIAGDAPRGPAKGKNADA